MTLIISDILIDEAIAPRIHSNTEQQRKMVCIARWLGCATSAVDYVTGPIMYSIHRGSATHIDKAGSSSGTG